MEYKKLHTDATVMVGVGKISPLAEKIMRVTKECLEFGIKESNRERVSMNMPWLLKTMPEKMNLKSSAISLATGKDTLSTNRPRFSTMPTGG